MHEFQPRPQGFSLKKWGRGCMSLFFVFDYFLTHQKGIKISDLADVRFPAVDFNCTPNVVPFILVKLLALALHRESPV